MNESGLLKLGYASWSAAVDPQSIPSTEGTHRARVIAVHKDRFDISDGITDASAELLGRLMFNADSALDLPTVGDWVIVTNLENHSTAIIHGLLPRKSLLVRKSPGKKLDMQLIAANVDVALIMQSLNENFNPRRLERYLVMVHESGIKPVVLLSKCDLLSDAEIDDRVGQIKSDMPDLDVVAFSNENHAGLPQLGERLLPGITCCLLGSSGVGKTSLLNNLQSNMQFKTSDVSRVKQKGRHTTTARQLIVLPSGAIIVDTPGMRELGNMSVSTGLDDTFADIAGIAGNCRFADCLHEKETGCAVLEAIESGEISAERYQNYLKMNREVAFSEASYVEKRRKSKKLGKLYKAIQREKKQRKSD